LEKGAGTPYRRVPSQKALIAHIFFVHSAVVTCSFTHLFLHSFCRLI